MDEDTGPVFLTRRIALCAAHRLHCLQLSDEDNKRIYGKCNNPNGHGHNYVIKVTVCGKRDPLTKMVMDASILKEYMMRSIMNVMDHKCLEKDVDYFKDSPSTVENIAVFVWKQMEPLMKDEMAKLYKVKVHETENITATYRG